MILDMPFTSLPFFLFLAVVLLFYLILPRKGRCLWLLAASYFFCGCYAIDALLFLVASTAVSWGIGRHMPRAAPNRRKLWLAAGIILSLGSLLFFKYTGFLLRSLSFVWPRSAALLSDGIFSSLIVPVGLSFYTFQILGYLVDIYQGKAAPENNFLRYALFVAFFPKLVQGPIERSDHLLVQLRTLESLPRFDFEQFATGLTGILWGLFQKMVLADRLSVFVNTIFDNPAGYGSVQLIAASLGYTFQLYLDFSGYTFMALGIAQLFGLQLLENFNAPYLATSTADFWRRWHITLSSWFRDYVYIPLGGNRVSKVRHLFNIFLTMLVSGLWHGASWNFVAWGALHGLYQVAGVLTRPLRRAFCRKCGVRTQVFSYRLGQRLCTFCFISFAWIFFRANGLQSAFVILSRMVTRWNPWVLFDGTFSTGWSGVESAVFWLGLTLVFCSDILREKRQLSFPVWLRQQNLVFRWGVCFTLVLAVAIFGMYGIAFDSSQFLYFNF